jgi:ubiquinone/menaquinone biosynthesis C-methylase UbiE
MSLRREAEQQYLTTDPLKVRIETHQQYSERQLDLDAVCTDALALNGDEAILDVGCGPGTFLSLLRGRGYGGRLVGLDRSEAMIGEASARDGGIEWVVGDAERLPYADGEFGRVSARHMLYYVDDLSRALQELARVTAPYGLFLATTNASRSTPMIDDLYLELLSAFGLAPRRHAAGEFHTETAVAALRAVWPHVEEAILDNTALSAARGATPRSWATTSATAYPPPRWARSQTCPRPAGRLFDTEVLDPRAQPVAPV